LAVKFNQKELDRMIEEAANWQPPAQAPQANPQELLQKLRGKQPVNNQVGLNAQNQ